MKSAFTSGIELKQIHTGTREYEAELKLREDILRRPLGLKFSQQDITAEEEDIHIGAFVVGYLVGVLVLRPSSSGSCIRMRQVAVSEERQRRGIGALLVDYAERLAASKGFDSMELHARATAIDFYKRLGYSVCSEEFTEVGIPHRIMRKQLNKKR